MGNEYTDEFHQILGGYNKLALTKKSSLIGGVSIAGCDPESMTSIEYSVFTYLVSSLVSNLTEDYVYSQFYIHSPDTVKRPKKRNMPLYDLMAKKQHEVLAAKQTFTNKVIHTLELLPKDNPHDFSPTSFLKNVFKSIGDKSARKALFRALSDKDILEFQEEQLSNAAYRLNKELRTVRASFERFSNRLTLNKITELDLYNLAVFLSSFDNKAFRNNAVPEDWLTAVAGNEVTRIHHKGYELLRINGARPLYARIASVSSYGSKTYKNGLFSVGATAPITKDVPFVIINRFTPYSKFKQDMMLFSKKEREITRKGIKPLDMVTGRHKDQHQDEMEKNLKPYIKKQLDELRAAQTFNLKYGDQHTYALTWSYDIDQIVENSDELEDAFKSIDTKLLWESYGLLEAYKSVQLANADMSLRNTPANAAQFGASSLIASPDPGQETVKELNGDECLFRFRAADGSLFHYTPWHEQRNLVLAIGAIRSGKSFFKTTMQTHFQKYDGRTVDIGVDDGVMALADFYKDYGSSIFDIETLKGFNIFSSKYEGKDPVFKSHINALFRMMLKFNNADELKTITASEQMQLDRNIERMCEDFDRKDWSLSTLIGLCHEDLELKFKPFLSSMEGEFARFVDAENESLINRDTKFSAFNLRAIKNNPDLFGLVMSEIIFRCLRMFEAPENRGFPKALDIDEAHVPLKMPNFVEFLDTWSRTMGKYYGSISMWTQGVKELSTLDNWDVLKGACTTFLFFADNEMNKSLYKKTFDLSDGEVEAIANLIPLKEFYIIQRGKGVSKKLSLEVPPLQMAINTSKPDEVMMRKEYIERLGSEQGYQSFAERLKSGKVIEKEKVL
jgi:type IV secretion system protein VirB4